MASDGVSAVDGHAGCRPVKLRHGGERRIAT